MLRYPKIVILYSALITGLCLHAGAQHQNIRISSIIDDRDPQEPSIAIDPGNTDYLVAGSNLNNVYCSEDGGYTWEYQALTSSMGVWGDPCIISDEEGNFYYFHLANPPGNPFADRIICQKSVDHGLSWEDGSFTEPDSTRLQDKEWAIVDNERDIIYVTWTMFDNYWPFSDNIRETDSSYIRFSRSFDGGKSWDPPKRLNKVAGDCWDMDNTVEGAVPAVGPEGEVYVSWAGPAGLVFDRSLDSGNTWLDEDIFVSDIPGGWDFVIPGIYRSNGFPVTACDISDGAYRGNIYINWSDQRNGYKDTDIWFVKSNDGGDTWSSPLKVNTDLSGKHQFFNWMAVDQVTGHIYIVFYDRRNYEDNNTDVYLAVSRDGGESFIDFKISQTPFIPYGTIFFGDYNNITAHNNVVRPIWTRLHDGMLSLWTAIVDPDPEYIEENQHVPYRITRAYPNPFRESTFISFKLYSPAHVSLSVYDALGREICILIHNEMKTPGKYVEQFHADRYALKPGVYYFALNCDGKISTQKVIVSD